MAVLNSTDNKFSVNCVKCSSQGIPLGGGGGGGQQKKKFIQRQRFWVVFMQVCAPFHGMPSPMTLACTN